MQFKLQSSFSLTLPEQHGAHRTVVRMRPHRVALLHIVTCIPIARQRLGKHILATNKHATIGYPLLGNETVKTPP
jgi:hypothetical protein